MWARLPIKYRLSLAFGASVAVVVAALSVFVYAQTAASLLAAVDAGLGAHASQLIASARDDGPAEVNPGPVRLGNGEIVVAQIDDASGRVLRSAPGIARSRLLPAADVRALRRPAWFDRMIPGIANLTRILAVPVAVAGRHGRLTVIVGASLEPRHSELAQLATTLAVAGSAALLLICVGAWHAIAGALRPVERMRRQAAEVSASDPGRRLSTARGHDEIALLGATLNQMLDRIEESVATERRLVDRASHELRTPLAIQRIDIDVALSGPRTVQALTEALASVSEENAHLTRLMEDLLVLSRARAGALPIQRAEVALPALLDQARRRRGRLNNGAQLDYTTPDCVVRVDPVWFRQALENMIDNALQHTPPGGRVEVSASLQGDTLTVAVADTGPGFDEALLVRAFEPFARSSGGAAGQQGSGLGLAVVNAIARAHDGRAWAENRPAGGARVVMEMNAGATGDQPCPNPRR